MLGVKPQARLQLARRTLMSLGAQTFLVVTDDSLSESAIRTALPTTTSIRFVPLQDALDSAESVVADTAPSVVLVSCSSNPSGVCGSSETWRVFSRAARSSRCTRGNPNGFMEPAFRAGADDLIVLPQPPDQLAFEIAEDRRAHGAVRPAMRSTVRLITVLGPKGGTGKTVTATNLAVALADRGAKPLVVDIDLQFGDVGLALGLRPDKTIYDLVTTGGSLDADKIEGFAIRHCLGAIGAARSDAARSGRGRHDGLPARPLHGGSTQLRLRDRRHGAGVLARGDRGDRCGIASLPRRHARRALAQGHEDRPRDARADGLLARRRHARPQPRRHAASGSR